MKRWLMFGIPVVALILVAGGLYFFVDWKNITVFLDRSRTEKIPIDLANSSVEESVKYPLKITAVKPSVPGTHEVHQITVTFNKPMVPLGDFEKLAQGLPISITPEIPCHWRWLNRMTIACQLDKPLPGSNAYTINVGEGIKAFDGTELEESAQYNFTTAKWRFVYRQVEWQAPDLPTYFFSFTQPMKVESLQEHITTNCGEIKVHPLSNEEAEEAEVDPIRSYRIQFLKNIGLDKKCVFSLPGKMESQLGPENGQTNSFSFNTYPEFTISAVNCAIRIKEKGPFDETAEIDGCVPDSGVNIEFSAPVLAKDLADRVEVEPFFGWSKGGYGSPEYLKQNPDEEYNSLYLQSPMEGKSKHTVTFTDLKDKFGRSLQKAKVVEISTDDFRPMLKIPRGYGVFEKDGPHQLPYTSVNVEEFKLNYFSSKNADDVDLWKGIQKGYKHCRGKIEPEFKEKFPFNTKQIVTGVKTNIPGTLPLDLDQIDPEFKYGMFFGRVTKSKLMDIALKLGLSSDCHNFFLVVTDLGIMGKVGFYDSGVWIHSLTGGQPLEGVRVSLRGYDSVLAQGVTDKDGFVKLPGAVEWDPERKKYSRWSGKDKLFIVAETDDDFSVLPFRKGQRGINYYDFSYSSGEYISSQKLLKSKNHLVHAITDRPLYQPGQEVKIKIFARHWEPRTFGLRPDEKVELVVKDSMGKDIHKKNLTLSEFGTAHSEFKLDPGAPLGYFSIRAKIGNWKGYIGSFDVQEFQLPAFKVEVASLKENLRAGDTAKFQTKALYHFGGGVAKTKGKYHVTFRGKRWKPSVPKWKKFNFDDPISLNLKGYNKPRSIRTVVLESQSFQTDKQGEVAKSILLPANQIQSYGVVSFESKFADDRGKTISGTASTEVFYSDLQLGIQKKKWTYEATEQIEPEVILLGKNEKPVAGAKVELKLVHRKFSTVRIRGAGNYFSYNTRTTDKIIDECEFNATLKPTGCKLQPKAAGSHFIVAETKDAKGRLAQSSIQVYITGAGYVGWFRENHDRIDIIPDKNTYKVGETLSLLVKNPYEEVDAIFTLERFGILKKFRKKLTQGSEIVKIPIDQKDYAPGFNLSVHLIKGRVSDKIEEGVDLGKPSFKMGLTKITVVNPDTTLDVFSVTDSKEYQPGDMVKVSVKIKSPSGANRTELSVAVVDERILQLSGNYQNSYDLHSKFYNFHYGDVVTSQMLSYVIGRRHFGKKGAPSGGDGAGFAIRKDFLPMAYWNPALVTDANGRASFSFKTPDNLTGWRILIVAADKEHRFGFGGSSFKTKKNLMLEPALPAFLTEGDKLNGRITVFNRTGKDNTIQASLELENAELASPNPISVSVKNNGKSNLEWKLIAPTGLKETRLTVKAQAGKDRDAALYKIPIRPFLSYETFATYGSTEKDKISIPLKIPDKIRTDLGGVDLIVSPSLISHLDDVFRYAFNYPYTCWEQTLVRALMLNNYNQLKDYVSIPDLGRNPDEWIQELLAVMPDFQASNGGMGYWKNHLKTVDPYLSTFTALGLVWLNQSKVPVPKSPSYKLFKYVRGLRDGKISFPKNYSDRTKATVLAMAVYVTSLLGDDAASHINKIYSDKDKLSMFGKTFLWMAAARNTSTKPIAENLRDEIYSTADMTSGSIQFQEVHDDGFKRILHSTTRTNCNILTAMLESEPGGQFVEPLVRWTIGTRKANRWNNTQENLYCLNALANYSKVYEKTTPDFTVTGDVMGKDIAPVKFQGFKGKPNTQKTSFTQELVGKDSSVNLTREGKGRSYYTARMRIAYKEVRTDEVNSGMQVSRTYSIKDAKGKWVPQTAGTVNAKRGDLLQIHLKVTIPATRYQVALADSLPAGFEPLNTALGGTSASDSQGEANTSSGSYNWNEDDFWWGFYWNGGFYHQEIRLHGAQYFADFLDAGTYDIKYVAQAVATGEFNVNPTMIEQMYEPEVYGKSTPAKFIITD